MKGRIGKSFKAEGRTAWKSKVTKVITSGALKDLAKGEEDLTGGLGVKPPVSGDEGGLGV